ncbi:MAG: hypothetical protein LBC17_01100 [Lactobacillaceae bacterium]|jgi:hypothetical protein|nr:hypothetical protein [Lactobacillaceae bacterium]
MKKYLLYAISAIAIFGIIYYGIQKINNSKENTQTKKISKSIKTKQDSSQNSSQSSANKEESSSKAPDSQTSPTSSFNSTIRTSEGSKSDLGQARILIYQEGIDSSPLSDDDILKLWNNANKNKTDFIKKVKEKLNIQ